MPLLNLSQALQSRRYISPIAEGTPFYVYDELRELVNQDVIVDVLTPLFDDHGIDNAVKSIKENGIRLLCILAKMDRIDQITNFLQHDTLDNKLPIRDKTTLEEIAPGIGSVFEKYQWEFFPLVFEQDRGHLILPKSITLPFISHEVFARGSSGEISVATIAAKQHNFFGEAGRELQIVRKQIEASRNPNETIFKSERKCLELYRRLNHPNIIHLLGSFTLDGYHNLLFPKYARNLDDFLQDNRSGKFHSNETFASAVLGLASALEAVHDANWRDRVKPGFYTKYGYHHDFRPANILVTDSTFILADFGLAQFGARPPIEEWDENIGHYIAPECMDANFIEQQVGCSYDIWAFGCFLGEIASYMALGPAGIEQFASRRKTGKYYDTNYTNSYFFDGKSKGLKSGVEKQLHELSIHEDPTIASFASLSREMLKFLPQDRLPMHVQSIRLSFIHAKCLFHLAICSLKKTLNEIKLPQYDAPKSALMQLQTVCAKLEAFGDYLHMYDHTKVDCGDFKTMSFRNYVKDRLAYICTNYHFSKVDLVKYTHEWASRESQADIPQELPPLKIIDESIEGAIQELCEGLPIQEKFERIYHSRLFGPDPSERMLQEVRDLDKEEPTLYADVGREAKLRLLDKALMGGDCGLGIGEDNLILDWSQVQGDLSTFGKYHNIGVYMCDDSGNGRTEKKVLIEWVFISQFPEGESAETRVDKLLRLARLLRFLKPSEFCTLGRLGFLPPKPETAYESGYGFIYPLPTRDGSVGMMDPRSLRRLLDDKRFPITLGEKFNIAKRLATSIFHLHSRNWLHKNIRSDNVLFCGYEDTRNEKSRAEYEVTSGPYVIGFHHGRPDDKLFHSDLPSSVGDREILLYRHPSYVAGKNRFLKAYDRYSLAIVLIELAYWRPAQNFQKHIHSENGPLLKEPIVDVFDKKYSRALTEIMGNAYMEATRACLGIVDKSQATSSLDTSDVPQFYTDVVSKLNDCYVG
ncbi:hypothetical protein ABKA04_003263 [Annulohypoxylon sp. FPYF3050]